jgi:hypothetical protein
MGPTEVQRISHASIIDLWSTPRLLLGLFFLRLWLLLLLLLDRLVRLWRCLLRHHLPSNPRMPVAVRALIDAMTGLGAQRG